MAVTKKVRRKSMRSVNRTKKVSRKGTKRTGKGLRKGTRKGTRRPRKGSRKYKKNIMRGGGNVIVKGSVNIVNIMKILARRYLKLTKISEEDITPQGLGEGGFGEVNKGEYFDGITTRVVACKSLYRGGLEEDKEVREEELKKEASIMAQIGDNEYIVSLLGIIEDFGPFFVILEYCEYGDLKGCLEKIPNSPLKLKKIEIMIQIAKGMKHISKKNFVHRDLAARNVLVCSPTKVKITDFGLARKIDSKKGYYKYVQGDPIPVQWTGPEGQVWPYPFRYTEKSDVWSFGIVCIEIINNGQRPYINKKPWQVKNLIAKGIAPKIMIKDQYRLIPPNLLPYFLTTSEEGSEEVDSTTLSQRLFSVDPDKRDTFDQIIEKFEQIHNEYN